MPIPVFTPSQIAAYVAHRRSVFNPKTDDPVVNKLRHDVVVKGNGTIERHSRVANPDVGMWVEASVAAMTRTVCRTSLLVTDVVSDSKSTYQTMPRAKGVALAEVTNPQLRLKAYADIGCELARLHTIVPVGGAGFVYPSNEGLTGMYLSWGEYLDCRLMDHIHYAREKELVKLPWGPATLAYRIGGLLHDRANSVPLTLLHGDLSDHNLFVDPERGYLTAMIDWEDALVGDPLFDLANWATFHDAEETTGGWEAMLNAYYSDPIAGRKRDRPWDFEWRFWTYYLRISLSKMVQLHRYNVPDLTRARSRIDRALEALKQ